MRPRDWSAVGLAADPVPGDVILVLDGGNDYLEVAESIGRAAHRVSQLDSGGMVSGALDALAERREETVTDIQRAHDRYAETGRALVDYAHVLEAAQSDSAAALQRARTAASDVEVAQNRRRYYLDLAQSAEPAERSRWERLAESADDDAADSGRLVDAARGDIADAVARRDRAAEQAIAQIQEITEHDGLNDGWWDNWGADLVAAISDIAGKMDDAIEGQRIYRLYGRNPDYDGFAAGVDGGSWTPVHPSTLRSPRSTMGLPTGGLSEAYNAADNLVVAELVDASRVVGVRHGLPLDGFPGGAPEFVIPGGPVATGAVRVLEDVPFVAGH